MANEPTAVMALIERVERLEMTGEIGDGTVAQLHELASRARMETQGLAPRVVLAGTLVDGPHGAEFLPAPHPVAQPDYAALGIDDPEAHN